jgi:hypothetical protein
VLYRTVQRRRKFPRSECSIFFFSLKNVRANIVSLFCRL